MILVDTQHSKPHMTLYRNLIILSWGGRILHKYESLMIILLSVYFYSFSLPSSLGLTMLLRSSCTETCNNNFVINF